MYATTCLFLKSLTKFATWKIFFYKDKINSLKSVCLKISSIYIYVHLSIIYILTRPLIAID